MFRNICMALCCSAMTGTASDLIEIGNLGNPGKDLPFTRAKGYARGTVCRPYRIAVDEVTNREYAAFLNRAGQTDSDVLWHPSMAISRSGMPGRFRYEAQEGKENLGVNFVSRVAAARYCNWLTGDTVYHITTEKRPNQASYPAIAGWRDRTTPTAGRLYFLPDMHEFYKAGFYDGKGAYRTVTAENRHEPSYYGLRRCATGVREWMDNKVWGGNPFLLGAHDLDKSPEAWNTVQYFQNPDTFRDGKTGFRVAATATTDIAPFLPGSRRNFFFGTEVRSGKVRIRRDGEKGGRQRIKLAIHDNRRETVYQETRLVELQSGVNDLTFPLPKDDGYYELEVAVSDPVWEGGAERIPFAVMREVLPEQGGKGHFGFTVHLQRWWNSYTLERPDFDIIRNLGASIIRNDFGSGKDGARELFRTIRQEGFLPLAILRGTHYEAMRKSGEAAPAILKKWEKLGVPAEFALAAEDAFQLVNLYKNDITHWELGNEPTYWRITAEEYAQYAKALTKAIRLADPRAVVLLGDVNAIGKNVFQMGGGASCDGIATHIYGFYVPGYWGIIGKMRTLNGWMKAADLAKKPVWVTEIGVSTYSHVHNLPNRSLEEVRRYEGIHIVKSMLGAMAFGAEKVLPYTFRSIPLDYLEEDFGLCDRYGRPNPGAAGFRTVARLFGNAEFTGFLKDNGFRYGDVAGLCFRAPDGDDLIALWRNDAYGADRFELPFEKIIRPAVIHQLASQSDVRLYSVGGASRTLARQGGRLAVPVDEYPIFLKGAIKPERVSCVKERETDLVLAVAPKVQIIQTVNPPQSCAALSGIVLTGSPGQTCSVTVRVFNPTSVAVSGSLRLRVSGSWREWDWGVLPHGKALNIPADGMASAVFSIAVPAECAPGTERYIEAVFTHGTDTATDRVLLKIQRPEFVWKDWINYRKGVVLTAGKDATELRLSRTDDGDSSYGNFYLKAPVVFAAGSPELAKELRLAYCPDSAGVSAVSVLFLDAKGEYFQLRRNVRPQQGKWNSVDFALANLMDKEKAISWNGDKKVDFPIRLLGFNVDFRKDDKNAAVRIRHWHTIPRE